MKFIFILILFILYINFINSKKKDVFYSDMYFNGTGSSNCLDVIDITASKTLCNNVDTKIKEDGASCCYASYKLASYIQIDTCVPLYKKYAKKYKNFVKENKGKKIKIECNSFFIKKSMMLLFLIAILYL